MEKNEKNGTFFYKEWKRTERSFYKEWKRTKRTELSFEKNGCPTLINIQQVYFTVQYNVSESLGNLHFWG